MQKRLSDLQRDVNQLKNEKFRPHKFDNTPRFNYGRSQAYGQYYGRGHVYRQNFGRGQDNRQNGYRVNPQKENSQTDKKSENVGRGRRRARPLRSKVTTNQSSIQGSIGVSSAAQEAGMYVEADIHLSDTLPAVLSAVVVRKYERPSVTLRSALLKVSNSTASRIASFKFWGRDCLMCILISESARASIKCCFASVSRTFSGTVG
jgi:hypothetical protein